VQGASVTRLDLVSTLPQLQSVDLSCNCLVDLSALGQLKALLHLCVGSNMLSGAALVGLPTSLVTLAAPHNEISSMRGLGKLERLQQLDLSHNGLVEVSDISGLAQLRKLNLSHNKLKARVSLPLPVSLRELWVQSNEIDSLNGLCSDMPLLTHLDASHNRIPRLNGLEKCPALISLLLNDNAVVNTEALKSLHKPDGEYSPLRNLAVLDLRGCDVTKRDCYRLYLLYPLLVAGISLDSLDGEVVDAKEKVSALNKIGGRDKDPLQRIREKHFPSKSAEDEQAELELAAQNLQATYRGFADRKALRLKKVEMEEEAKATRGATNIQSRYRGKLARQEVEARKQPKVR